MKTCTNPQCGRPNDDRARYCVICQTAFGAFGSTTCPQSHSVDPTWTECPYCKGQAAAAPNRSRTVIESPQPAAAASAPPPPPPVVTAPAGGRRMTVFTVPSEATPENVSPAPRPSERKIVGVLITYSWRTDGQMFPIREGRNLIGRGSECEIRIAEDNTLSNVNSHITFRKGFTLGDMVSMSGTDINGTPIEQQFVALESGAKIRTGSTHWFFLAIPSQQSE